MLEALFPPCCAACGVLLRAPGQPELCRRCGALTVPLPAPLRCVGDVHACYPYDGPLAEALVRCKYGGDAALAGPLGRALAHDDFWRGDGEPWQLVTPVPMHPWRRWRRGFDHTALILRHAARAVPTGRAELGVLVRLRNDAPQASLPAEARARNLDGAFAVARRARAAVAGARVLVVDDVTTTGATLREAMATLRAAGAGHVGALALLRTLTH